MKPLRHPEGPKIIQIDAEEQSHEGSGRWKSARVMKVGVYLRVF